MCAHWGMSACVLWCVLPVWPCLSAITPLSGDIKNLLSWKDATAETFMPVPTQHKDPGVGWICHICMFHSLIEKPSRCQDRNCYSNLNKWCKKSGCSNAMTAALAYCSLVGLCIQGCASLKAPQIRSTWEAHWDQLWDDEAVDIQILLSLSHSESI